MGLQGVEGDRVLAPLTGIEVSRRHHEKLPLIQIQRVQITGGSGLITGHGPERRQICGAPWAVAISLILGA